MPLITDDLELVIAELKGVWWMSAYQRLTVSTAGTWPHSVPRKACTLSPLIFLRPLGPRERLVISLVFFQTGKLTFFPDGKADVQKVKSV